MAEVCEFRSTLASLHSVVNNLRLAHTYNASYKQFRVKVPAQQEAEELVMVLACADTLTYMATSHQIKQLTRAADQDPTAVNVLRHGLRDASPHFGKLAEEMFGIPRAEWHGRPNPTVRGSRFNFTHLSSWLLYRTLVGFSRNQKNWLGHFYYDMYRFVFRLYENGSRFADLIRPHEPTALNMDEMNRLREFAHNHTRGCAAAVELAESDEILTFEPVDILLMGRIAIDMSPKSPLLAVGQPTIPDHELVLTGYGLTRAKKPWPEVGFARSTGEHSFTIVTPVVERK